MIRIQLVVFLFASLLERNHESTQACHYQTRPVKLVGGEYAGEWNFSKNNGNGTYHVRKSGKCFDDGEILYEEDGQTRANSSIFVL